MQLPVDPIHFPGQGMNLLIDQGNPLHQHCPFKAGTLRLPFLPSVDGMVDFLGQIMLVESEAFRPIVDAQAGLWRLRG